jgi:hypothetical protein
MNRHGVGDERALHRRRSELRWPRVMESAGQPAWRREWKSPTLNCEGWRIAGSPASVLRGQASNHPGVALAEDCRGRVDQLLRSVLPGRGRSTPTACQLLPEALGCEEVQAIAGRQAVRPLVDGVAGQAAHALRSLAPDAQLLTAGEKSPVNPGGIHAEPTPWHGQENSAELTLPPLGVIWLVPTSSAH